MKLILLLSSIFIACGSFGQTADYLENNPMWRQRKVCAEDPCMLTHNFVYHLNGDSIVGPYTYKKVYKYGQISSTPMAPGAICTFFQSFDYFEILIRQDGKQMYVHDGVQDTLLYDFDLIVGDTLPQSYANWESDVVIENVDSMLIDGIYRKIFTWSSNSIMSATNLIEGVGSDNGLLQQMGPILDCGEDLLCHKYNSVDYLGITDCEYNLGISKKDKSNLQISAYPIPSNNEINVQFSSPTNVQEIKAVDEFGRQIDLKFETKNSNEIQVDISNLANGMYVLSLTTFDDDLINAKILVK